MDRGRLWCRGLKSRSGRNFRRGERPRFDLLLRMSRRRRRPAGQVCDLHTRAQGGAGQAENMHWMQPQGEEKQGPGYGVRGDRQPRWSQGTTPGWERRKHAPIPPILIGTVDQWETMNLNDQPSVSYRRCRVRPILQVSA